MLVVAPRPSPGRGRSSTSFRRSAAATFMWETPSTAPIHASDLPAISAASGGFVDLFFVKPLTSMRGRRDRSGVEATRVLEMP